MTLSPESWLLQNWTFSLNFGTSDTFKVSHNVLHNLLKILLAINKNMKEHHLKGKREDANAV